jgi:hypothetical protein
MNALDRLRQAGHIPDAYSWASIAITAVEAQALVELVDEQARAIADLRAQLADATPRRCSDCGRGARELQPWYCDVGNGIEVVGWLGPTCHRRRVDNAQQAAYGRESLLPAPGGVR